MFDSSSAIYSIFHLRNSILNIHALFYFLLSAYYLLVKIWGQRCTLSASYNFPPIAVGGLRGEIPHR